jgi:RecJ-like exonuclease
MICPQCQGEGKRIVFGCPGFVMKEIECDQCRGTGSLDESAKHFMEQAERFRADRRAAGMTLRKFCERTGMDVVAVSRMERGLDDPTPIIQALKEMV